MGQWNPGALWLPPRVGVSERPGLQPRSGWERCALCSGGTEPLPGAGPEWVWQRRTSRKAGRDRLALPSYVDINTIHLSTHPLVTDLLKMFNVKIIFEIREISKIMDYGIYVWIFACYFFTNHKPEGNHCWYVHFNCLYLEGSIILGKKHLRQTKRA